MPENHTHMIYYKISTDNSYIIYSTPRFPKKKNIPLQDKLNIKGPLHTTDQAKP